MSEQADINLYTSTAKEPIFRNAATFSRMTQLQVLDILFMYVVTLQYDRTIKHLNETREAINFIEKWENT
ncbi:hypothetical protein ACWE42_19235 [Sutcliffiella cohnii]